MLIRDQAQLARVCAGLKARGEFALDTEFIRDRTYAPRLCLVQVAHGDSAAAIDPLAGLDLGPLLECIFDPGIEVIVHAGWQDFEIFHGATGRVPRRVFDTQIAAALAGLGEEIGYAHLLERIAGVSLSKIETVTDWSRRPLTEAQLRYALDDVRYLPRLRSRLADLLGGLGRTEWFLEECRVYEDPGTYRRDPRAASRRYRGARTLSPASLSVLAELAAWRESEAAARDVPRGRVVADEVLVEVARRSPRDLDDLGQARGLTSREIERSGRAMLEAIGRGLRVAPEDRPVLPPSRADDPRRALLVDLLEMAVKVRADEARIAAGYLASRQEVAEMVDARDEGRPAVDPATGGPLKVLSGWRRSLVGDDLLAVLEGRAVVGLDRAAGAPAILAGPGGPPLRPRS